GFLWALTRQVPRILGNIRKEHQWLSELVRKQRVDGIISDNRYGLYHQTVPSVIMSHQLQISTGFGAPADAALRKLHYKYLKRFQACWVPDLEGPDNLSGSLGHPEERLPNTYYLGLLS